MSRQSEKEYMTYGCSKWQLPRESMCRGCTSLMRLLLSANQRRLGRHSRLSMTVMRFCWWQSTFSARTVLGRGAGWGRATSYTL